MSISLSAEDLNYLHETAESLMVDLCVILTPPTPGSETRASDGGVILPETESAPISCWFDPSGGNEALREMMSPSFADGVLRLPIGTPVNVRCRVRITYHPGGPEIEGLTYEIIQEPRVSRSAIVCLLRKTVV